MLLEVDLSRAVGDSGAAALAADLLTTNPALTKLNLSSNWLTRAPHIQGPVHASHLHGVDNRGFLAFCEALGCHASLLSLNLAQNKLARGAFIDAHESKQLKQRRAKFDVNYHTNLESVCALCNAINGSSTLKELDMSANSLGVQGVFEMADTFNENRILSLLNLSRNSIGGHRSLQQHATGPHLGNRSPSKVTSDVPIVVSTQAEGMAAVLKLLTKLKLPLAHCDLRNNRFGAKDGQRIISEGVATGSMQTVSATATSSCLGNAH
jgi:hypothetical protein